MGDYKRCTGMYINHYIYKKELENLKQRQANCKLEQNAINLAIN